MQLRVSVSEFRDRQPPIFTPGRPAGPSGIDAAARNPDGSATVCCHSPCTLQKAPPLK